MKPKTVLFIPSNANHVRQFLPIYKILKEKCSVLFITQGSFKNEGAEDALSDQGISFRKIDDYEKKTPEFILDKENVKIVIIGNDIDVIPQWFVNIANKMRIKTILIQDGILSIFHSKHTMIDSLFQMKKFGKLMRLSGKLLLSGQYKKITYGMGNCSHILVWGEASKLYLTNKGVVGEKIHPIGNILQHEVYGTNKFDIINTKRTVLYAPSDLMFSNLLDSKSMKKLVEDVCTAVSSIGIKLVIKPHPRENLAFYKMIAKQFDAEIEVSDQNVSELLSQCSLLVADVSTIILEAMLVGTPVVIFLPNKQKIVSEENFPLDLVIKNAVLFAPDMKTLRDMISKSCDGKNLISQKVVELALKHYLGKTDDNIVERYSMFVLKLLD